jgi:hypothetical protein
VSISSISESRRDSRQRFRPACRSCDRKVHLFECDVFSNHDRRSVQRGHGYQHRHPILLWSFYLLDQKITPVSPSATLSWTPSSSLLGDFNVYRSSASGDPYTKIDYALIPTPSLYRLQRYSRANLLLHGDDNGLCRRGDTYSNDVRQRFRELAATRHASSFLRISY